MAIQYKRILLKVSGEALSGAKGTGFDEATIASICAGIKAAHDLGVQIGIVVGGGNFWRGRSSGKMDRMDADKIGMLATVMNALAVKDALRQQGVPAVVMTSSFMPQVAEVFTSDKAIAALESGKIVVFGGGSNKAAEKRVRFIRSALEFRMELTCNKPRMIWNFNHFNNVIIGRGACENHSAFKKLRSVIVINLIAVAVALINHCCAVKLISV